MMEKYQFFYGTQMYEFERPKVSDLIFKRGLKLKMINSKYSIIMKPSIYKVVILNVYN